MAGCVAVTALLLRLVESVALIALVLVATSAAAEPPKLDAAGPFDSRVRLEVSERVRGELWSFFDTDPAGPVPNSHYEFLGNRFQAGLRITRDPLELFAQLQHSLVYPAPARAPGAGGQYFVNSHRETQHEAILRQAWLRYRSAFTVQGLSVMGGRQIYRDGLEAPAKDPTLLWLQRVRIADRLLGPFDYTHVGRSFDGGQLAYDLDQVNATAFGFVPTAGGFEISANREITDIRLAGVSFTAKEALVPRTSARLFWIYYEDDRGIPFVDNRPADVRAADAGEAAELHTVGAHVAHVVPAGPGKADLLAWAAGQLGDWQSLTHRAWAYALEAGYQLPDAPLAPWLRAGFDVGSGDGDPGDDRHGTFYQLLPTARTYAQFPFYNMMNNQDLFTQLVLRPHAMLSIRTDLHALRVTSSRDLLYAGGGPTSDDVFGYSGTPTGRRNALAYLVDVGITVTPTDFLTLYAYYGHAFGQGVIRQAFRGSDADYGYVEATLAF